MISLNRKLALTFFIFSLSSFTHAIAFARDINVEQHNASEARDRYNKAQANYESVSKQISTLEQHIAEQQAKLNELKSKQSATQTEIDQAKMDLDNKIEILNKAWEDRNK
jgi:peptidoglycan hydrolase CwlO-like protein